MGLNETNPMNGADTTFDGASPASTTDDASAVHATHATHAVHAVSAAPGGRAGAVRAATGPADADGSDPQAAPGADRGAGPGGGARSGAPADEQATVRIDIGELVLTGFGRSLDAERVTAAFEAELTRLVREHGVPLAADGAGHVLDALGGLPPLPGRLTARRLGQELARAVHEGLAGRGEAR